MNIGTICYATQSGLGHLAKMFYDNGVVNRILEIPHPRYESYGSIWYRPEDRFDARQDQQFLQGLDAIIVFENAWNYWKKITQAKKLGIKFIFMIMYEWSPDPLPVAPDLIICPSLLDIEYSKKHPHIFLNVPAPNPIYIPWRERNIALQFVHNAGHGQVGFAKGTPEVLEAFANYVRTEARLLVRGQKNEPRITEVFEKYQGKYNNITIEYGDIPYNDLFKHGDVYINAERYNGLSLPLQEAYSSGMLVMTSNRFPANTWLPKEPLIPVMEYTKHRVGHTIFDQATIHPKDIAKRVDEWYGKEITKYSQMGKQWAEEHSWDKMKPKYIELIKNIVMGKT